MSTADRALVLHLRAWALAERKRLVDELAAVMPGADPRDAIRGLALLQGTIDALEAELAARTPKVGYGSE